MERVGVSLLGVAFVERPKRRRAESGSNGRAATVSGDAPNRPGPTPSASWATSRNGDAGSRLKDMGAPATRRVGTGDTGEETVVTVNGQATDARSSRAAATPDASSKRLDETTSSADPKSGVSRV
jgi:hypothetical protein